MSNTKTGKVVKTNRIVVMSRFDELPRELRDVMREATLDWSVDQVYEAWKKGYAIEKLVEGICGEEARVPKVMTVD